MKYIYCAYKNRQEFNKNFDPEYRKSHKTEIYLAAVENDNFSDRERQIYCQGMSYGVASRFKHPFIACFRLSEPVNGVYTKRECVNSCQL